ncbi:hypothetical protein GDO86_015678 [Hymenochirus boettgeri]|uniref:Uncharacterized protein n=1 Tax=Hymenochirus boettgeri TaxID=247094 RepID=A0A8T2JYB1_9PIPI|nr:hypothetical protein GDO86_015678 [Hymenochirus boettgeri]
MDLLLLRTLPLNSGYQREKTDLNEHCLYLERNKGKVKVYFSTVLYYMNGFYVSQAENPVDVVYGCFLPQDIDLANAAHTLSQDLLFKLMLKVAILVRFPQHVS